MEVSAIQGMCLAPLSCYHCSQTHMLAWTEAEPREGSEGGRAFSHHHFGEGSLCSSLGGTLPTRPDGLQEPDDLLACRAWVLQK